MTVKLQNMGQSTFNHWLTLFLVFFGLFNILPFTAPVLMNLGWETGGKAVYTAYSPLCHQMAQRSFFMFGDAFMYNADDLPVVLTDNRGVDTLTLRYFKGDEELGWKVAWSDRMVYMYGATWLAGLAYAILRKSKVRKPISPWLFALLLLPMALDGGTHFLSDFRGLTEGFRYTNGWLATLTGHVFPDTFYRGDALGSFNSLMRLLSGVLFGIAAVWFAFPYIDEGVRLSNQRLSSKRAALAETQARLALERERLLSQRES